MKALPAAILSKDLKASDIPSGFKDWSQVIEFAAKGFVKPEPACGDQVGTTKAFGMPVSKLARVASCAFASASK
jgi:hypothetical protein